MIDAIITGSMEWTKSMDTPRDAKEHAKSYRELFDYGFTKKTKTGDNTDTRIGMHMLNSTQCNDGGGHVTNIFPSNSENNTKHSTQFESVFKNVSISLQKENFARVKKHWSDFGFRDEKKNMLYRPYDWKIDEETGEILEVQFEDEQSIFALRVRVHAPGINLRTYQNQSWQIVKKNWAGFNTMATIVKIYEDGRMEDVDWSEFCRVRYFEEKMLNKAGAVGKDFHDLLGLPFRKEKHGDIIANPINVWVYYVNNKSVHTVDKNYRSRGAMFAVNCFMQPYPFENTEEIGLAPSSKRQCRVGVSRHPQASPAAQNRIQQIAQDAQGGQQVMCEKCKKWWYLLPDFNIEDLENEWYCGDPPYDTNTHPYMKLESCRTEPKPPANGGGNSLKGCKKSLKKRKTKRQRKTQRKIQ
jgi:hypothetical protein